MTAFQDEVVSHVPTLRAFARSLTRDAARADDLVQDTLVKAFSNAEKFQQGTNMRAWLFTILRNLFYSDRRKAVRESEDPEGTLAAGLSVKPDHDGRLQYAEFQTAFAELSDEQREALTLIGALGMSYDEAAKMCGVATGTMKSRVGRARKELAERMQLDDAGVIAENEFATTGAASWSV
ncbi:sigma-70 family RNA polymerase sigma factor [Aliishimia ponticola]|uniref:RNA polymerase sigma factor n=1 Tax=Aliishimia ponticola TaxID=2499833 RepID=A0A4S4NHJ6_9RHOB|nr:sigma-70 family RNA polymerase sigma factor [Aliishimia ponticola]THH38137.1 sigma-70 family RNA polymerase sigma factor [Aliishimia ponticola]